MCVHVSAQYFKRIAEESKATGAAVSTGPSGSTSMAALPTSAGASEAAAAPGGDEAGRTQTVVLD